MAMLLLEWSRGGGWENRYWDLTPIQSGLPFASPGTHPVSSKCKKKTFFWDAAQNVQTLQESLKYLSQMLMTKMSHPPEMVWYSAQLEFKEIIPGNVQ